MVIAHWQQLLCKIIHSHPHAIRSKNNSVPTMQSICHRQHNKHRGHCLLSVMHSPFIVYNETNVSVDSVLSIRYERNLGHVCAYSYFFVGLLPYVCVHERAYVCVYLCLYVCIYAYIYVCNYAHVYVFIHACMYICVYVCMKIHLKSMHVQHIRSYLSNNHSWSHSTGLICSLSTKL